MVAHGIYNWTEVEVGSTSSHSCFYPNRNDPNNAQNASVSRNCSGHRDWADYDSGGCISETTYRFQQLSQVHVNA